MVSMETVNRTTSAPNSVLRYDVDKGQSFVTEFNIYPSSIVPNERWRRELNNVIIKNILLLQLEKTNGCFQPQYVFESNTKFIHYFDYQINIDLMKLELKIIFKTGLFGLMVCGFFSPLVIFWIIWIRSTGPARSKKIKM